MDILPADKAHCFIPNAYVCLDFTYLNDPVTGKLLITKTPRRFEFGYLYWFIQETDIVIFSNQVFTILSKNSITVPIMGGSLEHFCNTLHAAYPNHPLIELAIRRFKSIITTIAVGI